jgi:hypothetical protein
MRRPLLWGALITALGLAVANIPRPPEADRVAYRAQQVAAAQLEESTVDLCRESIRFEHPRAKPGFTRSARALPDGSFQVVMPFVIGKVERQARCIGRRDGSFEFGVEVGTVRMTT